MLTIFRMPLRGLTFKHYTIYSCRSLKEALLQVERDNGQLHYVVRTRSRDDLQHGVMACLSQACSYGEGQASPHSSSASALFKRCVLGLFPMQNYLQINVPLVCVCTVCTAIRAWSHSPVANPRSAI